MSDTKYYYIESLDKYISSTGGLYTDTELNELYGLEQEWKDSLPHYNYKELMDIFPEATASAKRGLKKEIAYWKERIADNNVARERYYNNRICKANFQEQNDLQKRSDEFHDGIDARYESKIKSAMFKLSHMEGKPQTKKGVDELDIETAKQVPIETLYDGKLFKHGAKGKGICPFHSENTPSFLIYLDQNTFYCYGCNKGGSAVDFFMFKENVTFLQAVKALTK